MRYVTMDNWTKVQIVDIPQYVADWIVYCKSTGVPLAKALIDEDVYLYNYAKQCDANKLKSFFLSNVNNEKFASAWVNGYTVKKEKYYYVAIPIENGRYRRLVVLSSGRVALGDHTYESLELLKKHSRQAYGKLTEKMIKDSPLSWAWQFAKELEL